VSAPTIRVSADWLALREPADAAARSTALVDCLRTHLPSVGTLTIHDLGSGTGSMMRWLAPQLAARQHWVLHDRDADLLAAASTTAGLPDASHVTTLEGRVDDVTLLTPAELADADLITASALLDMLTLDELARMVDTCVAVDCPSLLTISVIGRVTLAPDDPLDATIAAAFNAHQRRTVDDRGLLGPDAVDAAAAAFASQGWTTRLAPSPWRLGTPDSDLLREWLEGWVGAAVEWDPSIADAAADYLATRKASARSGTLQVTVDHLDLLAVPR